MVSALAVALVVVCPVVALLLLFVGFVWVVVVLAVLFPFGRYDKKKGQAVGACPLFVGCVLFYPIASGITKLLQAVSILRELPTIHAAVNWSLL